MKIILASASNRRKEILKKINLDFKIHPSDFDESSINITHDNPRIYCQKLAIKKASKISNKFHNKFIIGADTIVYCDNKIIGKPQNYSEAIKYLQLLSNKEHQVYTGVSLIHKACKINKSFIDKTNVFFHKLDYKDIDFYVKHYKPYDKAGAYGIQDWSSIFVKKINGCFYNVVGFPLPKFYKLFSKDLNLNNE
tara:strand:- start:954 stop:1535 length:582 start_codon:yes stop_codon:yes gene_type:complete